MKKLFLLLTLFGVLTVGCENLFPNEQVPNSNSVFVTDGEDVYIVGADGGEITIVVTTNEEYSVIIPDEATSWISVTNTRTDVRIDKLNFSLLANDSFVDRTATIKLVDSKNKELQKIVFVQKCYDKVFEIDADGNYLVDADGGEVNVAVTTNLEYNVAIPEEAQSWLSVADTRATVREETITFIVAKNNSYEERSASVELVDSKGDVLQTIGFIQSAVEMCPSNEIWYTNGSTTEPTAPYKTNVFGVNIVSNTYNAEKECWIIKFDGDVTEIGYTAFAYCSSLTSVTIPDSITSIGEGAFAYCSSLTSVTIPDSVTSIGDSAFCYCDSLTSITIPDSVTTIGTDAFAYCSSLTSVTIGDSVTTIGYQAFYDCRSLTSVTIPDSVTTIGDYAFIYCSSLTSVTIPDSVTTIGEGAFVVCDSLREFNGKYASEDGRCLIIDGTLNSFAIGCGVTEYTIPNSVTTIGASAFYDCRSLTSVTIPDSVTTIGVRAFYECSSLTSVTIPDSVTTIGNGAFSACSSLREFNGKYASEDGRCLIIDGTLNSFAIGCGVTEYTIPDSVTTIGSYAFNYCSSLTSITISNSVTEIGYAAFYNCSSLTSVTIPDSVTTIEAFTFYVCSGLTSVTIPDSVTKIGDCAFAWCSSLTSVTIPDSVTTIGKWAFAYCSSLTSVYCKAVTPPTAEVHYSYWMAFDDNASDRKIYVPVESVDVYKSATGWSEYADAIVGYEF